MSNESLPVIFAALMAISILAYVIMDGYDLGVGLLLPLANSAQKNTMIASIGPFWDANETWLVLGVGLLLVAFPKAHGLVLGALYLPVTFMLIGLILRGVAFDFRVKAKASHHTLWNWIFTLGSFIASFSQGVMLGRYITGFADSWQAWAFALLAGAGLSSAYALLGAAWLLMKTEGALQNKALVWIKNSVLTTAMAVLAVSIVTPLASSSVAAKWFVWPQFLWLSPLPIASVILFYILLRCLPTLAQRQKVHNDAGCWWPFACAVGIFILSFAGLAYSLFPYVVLDQLTIWQAASAPEALRIILWGTLVVLPTIVGYSLFSYRVFWGKATGLSYD